MSFEKKPLEQGKSGQYLIPYSKDLENRIKIALDLIDSVLDEIDGKPLKYPKPAPSGITDLNDNKLLGTVFHAQPTVSNVPATGTHFQVMTFGINTNYYGQLAIHGITGRLYSRTNNNGLWSAWRINT